MSARTLRKLQAKEPVGGSEEDLSSDEEVNQHVNKGFNAFALLGDEEEKDESNQKLDQENTQEANQNPQKVPALPKQSKKNAKKNKGKNSKGKKKQPEEKKALDSDEELDRIIAQAKKLDVSQESSKQQGDEVSNDVYDFEFEFNESGGVRQMYDSNFKYFTTERLSQCLNLLKLNSVKDLDPDQELKALFGDLSSEVIDDANNSSSLSITPEVLEQYKRLARLTRGWGGRDKKSVPDSNRKLLLTRIRSDWLPTSQRPLQMEELKSNSIAECLSYKEEEISSDDISVKIDKEMKLGVKYFKFEKINTPAERVANSNFYAAVVMTADSDTLIQLIRTYPYHAETLLQMSMVILRQGGDKVVSHAFIERALFVFDRSFNKNFHGLLSEGEVGLIRLPYEFFSNRQFYLCLFRYIIILGERSTYYTALSYCKFLLSLAPTEDPLGVRYFIDYYAILSEEYEFLVDFVNSPLVMTYSAWSTPGLLFSASLANLALHKLDEAKELMNSAFKSHPYVAFKLLEMVGVTPNEIGIKEGDLNTNKHELLAAETYLVRATNLWNTQERREFLKNELLGLFKANYAKKGVAASFMEMFKSKAADNTEIPINLIRFAVVSGESKIMARIPQQAWNSEKMFEYDVLPPQDTRTSYDEFTGVGQNSATTTSLLDYVDQNVIASILQAQSGEENFDDILRQLAEQDQTQEE